MLCVGTRAVALRVTNLGYGIQRVAPSTQSVAVPVPTLSVGTRAGPHSSIPGFLASL
jgi:hypothetical protein